MKKLDIPVALFFGFIVLLILRQLPHLGGYAYFAEAAKQLLTTGQPFSPAPLGWLNELIPTAKGYIFVFPPLPLMPMLLVAYLKGSELLLQQILAAGVIATTYLLSVEFGGSRRRAIFLTIIMFLATPVLRLARFEGSWFTAQLLSTITAQLTAILINRKNPFGAGILAGLTMLSRLSVVVGIAIAYGLYLLKRREFLSIIKFGCGLVPSLAIYLLWNYYRFDSFWQSGYALIPGVLLEPWYPLGIVNLAYIWPNLKRYVLQIDFRGHGVGLVLAQPFLLFLLKIPRSMWMWIFMGVINLLVVVAHGGYGWVQYDFRFLLDSLWIWIPILSTLSKKMWWGVVVLGIFACLIHLPVWGVCPQTWMCALDKLPVSMSFN